MKIRNIMVTNVISVAPETKITDVAEILFRNRFHGLPVLKNNKVVGIITEDDFFLKNFDDLFLPSYIKFLEEKKIAQNLPEEIKTKIKKLSQIRASDIMTADCVCVSPEMNVAELMELIKKTSFTTFPVINKRKEVVGIVTLSDILGIVQKGSREMKKTVEKTGATKLDKLIRDLNSFWNDQIVVITRQKVSTWKGLFVVAVVVIAGAAALFIFGRATEVGCNLEKKVVYPLECTHFTYSDWSQCRSNGTQIRQVLNSLPKNCENGTPEVIRLCR